ncbi:hypothetical protein ACT7DA_18425 [Bacillus pacificus]
MIYQLLLKVLLTEKKFIKIMLIGVTSFVRECISKVICENARNPDGKIYAALFSDSIELDADVVNNSYQGYLLNWDLDLETRVVEQVQRVLKQARLMEENQYY